jgi:hemerythrin superfamily protein
MATTTSNTASKSAHAASAKAEPREIKNTNGALWGAAAAGVAVGVAAMIGRKVAVQAPTALAGEWDAALAAEHAAVAKLFDALEETTSKNATKRSMLLAQLKHALAKHALQEENTIYPALRDAGQTEAADGLNKDHGYVKQYLYELTNCPKESEAFLSILRRFREDLDRHVREEEDTLFPALKAQLSVEANRKLTVAMNKEGFKLA